MTEPGPIVPANRRDPWPSPQQPWPDPPWLMTGRALTAWFDVPWGFLQRAVSPDLLPPETPTARIRLRFYDLSFTSVAAAHVGSLAPRSGQFREAVVGVPARVHDTDGEVSIFMWADAESYLTWGREVFGWPLQRAEVQLRGPIWRETPSLDGTGACVLRSGAGSATLDEISLAATAGRGSPAGIWLTPRRILHVAGLAGETRDVLVVRPDVRRAGSLLAGTCRVAFDFDEPHPLAGLGTLKSELDVADGFELLIGADVTVL